MEVDHLDELESSPYEDDSVPGRTAYDAEGRIVATQLGDGTWIPPAPSNIGQKRVDPDEGVELEVVWDGAAPDKFGGGTKGELLGPYRTRSSTWDALKRAWLKSK